MKKVLSILVALLLMCCAVASVSAEISPIGTEPTNTIIVDAVPVPNIAGTATPTIDNPGQVNVNVGETITLTATPLEGYIFSHWEFLYGEFEVVEGDYTTPVIVIKPIGSSNVRAEAHFVEDGQPVTPPASKPVTTLPTDTTSPITGADNTGATINAAVIVTIAVMAIGAVVVLKKKTNA